MTGLHQGQTMTPDQDAANATRKRWMSVLARSSAKELAQYMEGLTDAPSWNVLRKPETGLVMVRGRAGGQGQRFNLGETTVTRCSISLANGVVGHSWIRGRDKSHAELAAVFDALMQDNQQQDALTETVITPITKRLAALREQRAATVAKTRVDFYTLARGED